MQVPRTLDLPKLLKQKSFFLFGPRATGKTSLIREQFGENALVIDLLKSAYSLRLSANPGELENIISSSQQRDIVVIDEVQKVPALLDEVHRLIEEKGLTFLLTGSSARKLKRGAANLLAGRAWNSELFPLTFHELTDFNLGRYLLYGGLPSVYLSKQPEEELDAYVNTYLYEELQAEGIVRKLDVFSRFLTTAAISNGEILNYANVASDAQMSPSTVRDYFSILEDTLLGFLIPPWSKSVKRKATQTAKFFLFDPGVTNHITAVQSIERNSDLYGNRFETFIAMELRAYLSYRRVKHKPLSFWRSTRGYEVDFVIGDQIAIEVKSSKQASPRFLKGLRALQEENTIEKFFLLSQDPISTEKDGIRSMHWKDFLVELWADKIVG